jgi:hypothetical protein
MDSYLQDSQHLLQELEHFQIPPDCILYSCEFESLYTNLDQNRVLKNISEFMADKLDTKYIDSLAFHTILSIILYNNFFSFQNQIYLQIIGVSMGQMSGPDIANLAVYFDEILAIETCKPYYYKRFIDDMFLIAKYYFDLKKIFDFFHRLKITHNTGEIS